MKKRILLISVAVGAVALATGSYVIWRVPSGAVLGAAAGASTALPLPTPPADFKEYHNEQYGFSLIYPEDLKLKEFDEGRGANLHVCKL